MQKHKAEGLRGAAKTSRANHPHCVGYDESNMGVKMPDPSWSPVWTRRAKQPSVHHLPQRGSQPTAASWVFTGVRTRLLLCGCNMFLSYHHTVLIRSSTGTGDAARVPWHAFLPPLTRAYVTMSQSYTLDWLVIVWERMDQLFPDVCETLGVPFQTSSHSLRTWSHLSQEAGVHFT